MSDRKEDLKKELEAALFTAGKRMGLEQIAKICKLSPEEAEALLKELQEEYRKKESSLAFFQEGRFWKLTVKDKFLDIARKLGVETELPKSVIETLAVIAWRAPVKQSEVIGLRTNKAYNHLDELEKLGYISRQKLGRTKLIRLSEKFYEYFDIPEKHTQEMFRSQESLARLIEIKEKEIEDIKKEHSQRLKQEQPEQPKVEVVDATPPDQKADQKVEIFSEKALGGLEVYEDSEAATPGLAEDSNEVDKKVEDMLGGGEQPGKEDAEAEDEEDGAANLVGKGKEVKKQTDEEPEDILEAARGEGK